MRQRFSCLRFAGIAVAASLAGLSFGQSFAPVTFKGEAKFSYEKVSIPKGQAPVKGVADFWLKDDALLARVSDSDDIETTVLIRSGGTLVRDLRKGGASSISFYGQSHMPQRLSMSFLWAKHPLLGSAESRGLVGRVSFLHLAQDPRVDRRREGDIVLDGNGRLKNLFWPDKSRPEVTLTISGWKEVEGQFLPERIDQDIQQVTESVSDTWTLRRETPKEASAEDFTFEGQLDSWLPEGQRFVPVNDCRVTISSCVGRTYTPKTFPLLDQIGTAGSESLAEPTPSQGFNPVFFIPIFTGVGAAIWLLLRKKKDGRK